MEEPLPQPLPEAEREENQTSPSLLGKGVGGLGDFETNPSPGPSPKRGGEKETAPPSLLGKGIGGLGSSFPTTGRLLGIDFGTVRVGLAVSDPDRLIASPLETVTRKSDLADAGYFARTVAAERIVGLVVGLPLHTGGEEGIKAREARQYGAWLTAATGLPVVFWDERCTTAAAEDVLWDAGLSHRKRRDRRDRVAAQLILQGFLDARCPPQGTQPPTEEAVADRN